MSIGKHGVGGNVLLLIGSLSLGAGEAMAIEESRFTVVEQADNFELRWYEPNIVAETLVEGDFSGVGNEGFRRLAGYIFGKNRKERPIEMTAPVSQQPDSEKIAMTAPVNQEADDGQVAHHLHHACRVHDGNSACSPG